MLDRNHPPVTRQIEHIEIPEPRLLKAPNGMDIYILDMGDQDVVRIDLMFGAGKWEQEKLLVAMFTNLMLKEGVEGMTSQEVAEHLDYYGAWLQPSATFHNSYVTLYSLNKHVDKTIPVLEKIIKNPLFPEHEFDVIRNRRKQQFRVDDEKVDVKAFNKFVELLYSKEYPYGNCAEEHQFDEVTREDLIDFHARCYQSDNCRIILTGRVTDEIIAQVIAHFGKDKWGADLHFKEPSYHTEASVAGRYHVEKPDAMQSAVRIGIPLVGRTHPDYPKLRVLNTLLGGYFGSRLMANIREEKGYTYGIGSSITTLKFASYLSIATQTATEYTEPLIKEVFYEIDRLKEELVSEEELEMMKGYLMGEMARLFDGPFSIADAHQSLLANDMTSEYYHQMIQAIQSVTAEELRDLARKYLINDQFYTVVAGQINS
ncbi:MAG: pitrilysin family protein [Bacteroidales bacterium]